MGVVACIYYNNICAYKAYVKRAGAFFTLENAVLWKEKQ